MSEKNSSKRRVAGSYAMSLVSITLVLFLLGFFAIFVLYARKLSNHIKENIGFEIVMYGDVEQSDILPLKTQIQAMPAVNEVEYITKDEALSRLSEDLGEDFLEWLGKDANPLLPSLDVRFHAEYVNTDSIEVFADQIREKEFVKDVYYQKSLVDLINQNIGKIASVLMVVSLVLLVIAIALIRNTIRLSIYAKRFLVRSMQLVGATESFIRRPFLRSGVLQGFFGGLLADLMLIGILSVATKHIDNLDSIQNVTSLPIILCLCGVIVLGVILAWFSTRAALDKFLKANLDKLYN